MTRTKIRTKEQGFSTRKAQPPDDGRDGASGPSHGPGVPPGPTEGKTTTASPEPMPMNGYGKREIKVGREKLESILN